MLNKYQFMYFLRFYNISLYSCTGTYIGESDLKTLLEVIAERAANNPGPFAGAPVDSVQVPIETATEYKRLVIDPN